MNSTYISRKTSFLVLINYSTFGINYLYHQIKFMLYGILSVVGTSFILVLFGMYLFSVLIFLLVGNIVKNKDLHKTLGVLTGFMAQ